MKYTIEGFSQAYAMTLVKKVDTGKKTVTRKIDCTDLVILRWFVDFYPNMKKVEVDGVQYAWLTHKKLQSDLPLIDINKRAFSERMQKMVDFGILTYKLVKEGGTFSLYGFGENYQNLVSNNGVRSNDIGLSNEMQEGMRSNDIGAVGQPTNKDTSIKYTSNKYTSNNIGVESSPLTEKPQTDKKEKYGTFHNVRLTPTEYEKLSIDFSNYLEAIEYLSEYLESTGKKYKSHYLALRRWVFDALKEKEIKQKELEQREKRAQEIAQKNSLHDLKSFYGRDYSEDEMKRLTAEIDNFDDIPV